MNAATAIALLALVLGGCSVLLDPEQHCPPVAQGAHCCLPDCGGEPGWSCYHGTDYAECRATCTSSSGCSGAGSICVSLTCTTPCDPVAQTGCLPEGSCYVTSSGSNWGTTCTGGGGRGAEGSDCERSTWCQPGHICTGANTCRPICNVATGEGCADRECLGFLTPLMIGGVEYGFCRPCVAQGSTCCIPDCGDGWSCSTDASGYAQCRAACASSAECSAGVGSICLVAGCSTPCDPVAQTVSAGRLVHRDRGRRRGRDSVHRHWAR